MASVWRIPVVVTYSGSVLLHKEFASERPIEQTQSTVEFRPKTEVDTVSHWIIEMDGWHGGHEQ